MTMNELVRASVVPSVGTYDGSRKEEVSEGGRSRPLNRLWFASEITPVVAAQKSRIP
jgi:hypothetical protein